MSIKHKFTSAQADGGDTSVVRPSNWNDDHQVTSFTAAKVPVAFSATPSFDASLGNSFKMTLTGNITSMTFSNLTDGQEITLLFVQDGTGNHTVAWPAAVKGGIDFGGAAILPNAIVTQKFHVDGTTLIALAPGTVN